MKKLTQWQELLKHLRRELSPDADKSLSQDRFAHFLGVSWSTIARWESGRWQPGSDKAKQLDRLRQILDKLGNAITRDSRLLFFEQQHPPLLNLRPIDLLAIDKGFDLVLELVESLNSGDFA